MSKQGPPVLDNVARIWLRPTAELLNRASSEMEAALAATTFLECHSWIELGLLAELFSPSAAEELLGFYFRKSSPAFDVFKNQSLWPGVKIETLRDATSGDRPFLSERATQTFGNPSAFRTRVQTAMLAAANLAFDQSGQAFVTALLFATEDRWSRVLRKKPSAHELLEPLAGTLDIWLDGHGLLVYAGLVRTIDQIESLLFTIESDPPGDVSEPDDWFAFQRNLVAAQGWRLRPRTLIAQERFKQLLSLVDDALRSSLLANGVKADGGSTFSSHAEQILKRWIRATEPRTQSA
jgi:hypothetical protein